MNGPRSRATRKSLALLLTAKPAALGLGVVNAHVASAANVAVACGDVANLILKISDANSATGPTVISLGTNCTYTLTTADHTGDGLPNIANDITIDGNGSTITRDNAAPDFRILHVTSRGTLTVNHTTVSNGRSVPGSSSGESVGGGINNAGGVLNVNSSTITRNHARTPSGIAAKGGGISSSGTTTVTDSTISANTANNDETRTGPISAPAAGGGIAAKGGTLTVRNSTISGNTASSTNSATQGGATASGGGIAALGGNPGPGGNSTGVVTVITGSTLSGNVAIASTTGGGRPSARGGGMIANDIASTNTPTPTNQVTKLANNTVTGNSTSASGGGTSVGGGVDLSTQGTGDVMTVVNNTIAANTSAQFSGIHESGPGSLTSTNNILAGNAITNCGGTITNGGHNLNFPASDTSCTGFANGDPVLGPLKNNGGPTWTMALGDGSAAIDTADPAKCTTALPNGAGTIDQRGDKRFEVAGDATCDVGAYEVQPVPVIAVVAAVPNLPKAGQLPNSVPGEPVVPVALTGLAAAAALALALRRRQAPI
jgi:hypothetical protein